MTPGSGQRIDLRHGFDFGPVERARQLARCAKQHADTRRIALDHLDRTGHWHGRRLQHPQIPPRSSSAHEALEQVRAASDRRQFVARRTGLGHLESRLAPRPNVADADVVFQPPCRGQILAKCPWLESGSELAVP